MRITRVVTLLIFAVIAMQSTVFAQQRLQKKAEPRLREIVDACVVTVRQESDAQYTTELLFRNPQLKSTFNAYSESNGMVQFIGSKLERFSFKKCMHDTGYPIK
jgi:hypothetical protein